MIKRLHVYFKERYPIIPRIILGIILFLEIYEDTKAFIRTVKTPTTVRSTE